MTKEDVLNIAWKSKDLRSFKNVLESGADINKVCWDQNYLPIFSSVVQDATDENQEFVSSLIQWNVDKNEMINGQCPIHRAIKNGSERILEILIEQNINVNIRNIYGDTPLHCLCTTTWDNRESYHKCAKMVLSQPNIAINALNGSKLTPIQCALDKNNQPMIKLLLEYGGTKNINIDTKNGEVSIRSLILLKYPELTELVERVPVFIEVDDDESKQESKEEDQSCLKGEQEAEDMDEKQLEEAPSKRKPQIVNT